jgi:hypothetical protein
MNSRLSVAASQSLKKFVHFYSYSRSVLCTWGGGVWGDASVIPAPLTPMTTTCHGFPAYVSVVFLDIRLYRSSTSTLVAYSHLTRVRS